jgi:hypothetical protein
VIRPFTWPAHVRLLRWSAALVLLAGYLDLVAGGLTLAPVLLVAGYLVLIPLALLAR